MANVWPDQYHRSIARVVTDSIFLWETLCQIADWVSFKILTLQLTCQIQNLLQAAPYSKKTFSTRKKPFRVRHSKKKAHLHWFVGWLVGWSVRWLVGPSVGPSACWCPQPDRPKSPFVFALFCGVSLFVWPSSGMFSAFLALFLDCVLQCSGLLLECFPLFLAVFWGVFRFFSGHVLECSPLGLPSLGVFSWRHGGARRTRTKFGIYV